MALFEVSLKREHPRTGYVRFPVQGESFEVFDDYLYIRAKPEGLEMVGKVVACFAPDYWLAVERYETKEEKT